MGERHVRSEKSDLLFVEVSPDLFYNKKKTYGGTEAFYVP